MDMIILTCAGCGKHYKGHHTQRKYKCPTCANIFSFPSASRLAVNDTLLCSNCWTGLPAQEDLEQCPVCCQKLSGAGGEAVAIGTRISGQYPRTALEECINAELKGLALPQKELEAALAGLEEHVALYGKSLNEMAQERNLLAESERKLKARLARLEVENEEARNTEIISPGDGAELLSKVAELETRLKSEKDAREAVFGRLTALSHSKRALEVKISNLEAQLTAQDQMIEGKPEERERLADINRKLETRNAELIARASSEKAAKESALKDVQELRITSQELEVRLSEISKGLEIERLARETAVKSCNELSENKHQLNAKLFQFEIQRTLDREAKESAQKKWELMTALKREQEVRIAELESRLDNEKERLKTAAGERDESINKKQELAATLAEIKNRLMTETDTKAAVIKSRDKLVDARRELESVVAGLQARLKFHAESEERIAKERDALGASKTELESVIADLKARLADEQEAKEAALKENAGLSARVQQAQTEALASTARLNGCHERFTSALDGTASDCGHLLLQLKAEAANLLSLCRQMHRRSQEIASGADGMENAASCLENELNAVGVAISARIATVRNGLGREKSAKSSSSSATSTAVDPPSRKLDGLRVLVVEDDADSLEMVSTVLRNCGASVTGASSVPEALLAFELTRPDIVISDIMMPNEDGYALIGKIRARNIDQGGNVPAVALTACNKDEDRAHLLSAGYQLHVPKPVQPEELALAVARIVRNPDATIGATQK